MSLLVQLLLIIPCVLSCITTGIYAYIAYQHFKKPKDEIWEAALQLSIANGKYNTAGSFAEMYEELRFFKERGCKLDGMHLKQLMQAEAQVSVPVQDQDSANWRT